MEQGALSLVERREAFGSALAAMYGVRSVLHQAGNAELSRIAGQVAELRAMAGAALVAVVAESESRGIIAESQSGSTASWVADAAWHSRRESYAVAKAAGILQRSDMNELAESVLQADLDIPTSVVVAAEFDKIAPDLTPDAAPAVLEQFASVAAEHGPRAVRELREHLVARYGAEGEFEEHQERCRRQISLSAGRQTAPGLWDYLLTVGAEGRAVIEAAIGPLSAPRTDTAVPGAPPDPRSAVRRRGEALIEALSRSTATAGQSSSSPKAVLTVTMDYAELVAQVGSGSALGSLAGIGTPGNNTPLAPDTVRKIACDAHIIPVVLGGNGEILDQGRTQRLFTLGQVRALWQRDRHCTFPGCDIPAAWCDAHHLLHWIDGGRTDLSNGALLCARHHTVVHRDRLAGVVSGGVVVWDQCPNSYRPDNTPGEAAMLQVWAGVVADRARRDWLPPHRPRRKPPTPISEPNTVDIVYYVPVSRNRILRT